MHSRDPEWQDLESDLNRLLAMDAMARAVALDKLAFDNPSQASALRQWLDDIAQSEGLLERLPTRPHALAPGTPWRLLRPIGSGGMGEVWLGERADGAFQRQVAIKFLRADRATLGDRLIRERELLARLHHPGIAMLLDGGVSASGEPYLVTEWIDGVRLDHWVRDTRPDLRIRVDVLRRITEAVGFAHANLIVHRDLKPANVMIDRDGVPHLLDFGIARLLDDPQGGTLTEDRALTPAFAAPEQLSGHPITTRSDIYALGGLLYWLLTERTPHSSEGLALAELVKRVCTDAIRPPSMRAAVDARIDADLDAIVLTALACEPEQRFASAELLALDLRRWLDGHSVSARLPSRIERAWRFARLHRIESVLASGLLAALVAGSIGTTWQASAARRERDAANAERDTARLEILRSESLIDTFAMLFRDAEDDSALSANAWLDRAATMVTAPSPADAVARARLLAKLGEIEYDRGQPARALARFDQLLGSFEKQLSRAEHARALCYRASANASGGNLVAANTDLEAGNNIAERLRGSDRMALIECLSMRANIISASTQRARPEDVSTLERALQELDQLDSGGREAWRRAALLHKLATVHQQLGDYEAALRQFERVAAIDLQMGTAETKDGTNTLAAMAAINMQLGRLRKADTIYQRAIVQFDRLDGRSVGLVRTLANHAILKNQLGEADAAIALASRSIEMSHVVAPDDTLGVALAQVQIGRARIDKGQFQLALDTLRQAAAVYATARPPGDYMNLLLAAMQAEALIGLMEFSAAFGKLTPAIALARASGYPASRAACLRIAARLAKSQGDLAQAKSHLLEVQRAEAESFGPEHWRIATTEIERAEIERALGAESEVTVLLDHAQPIVERVFGPEHWRARVAQRLRKLSQ